MSERGSVANKIVAAVTIVIVALVVFFVWRIGTYYFAIKSGDSSKLPQFSGQFTLDPETADATSTKATRDALETADDPSFGADDAPLVIVEFLDYECPFCREASTTVRTVASRYADRVKVIVRDYPVNDLHPQALLVSEALGCAQEQDVFWSMHDRVFANATPVTKDVLRRIAEQSGADVDMYDACMDSHRRLPEIQEDIAAGDAVGVRGTPTFFFNGTRVEGSIPEASFESIIQGFVGNP